MTPSIFISIVLSFLAVSTESMNNDEGISSYCEKSRLSPFWYVPTPIECCNSQGKCDMYIKPKQTKYGLTNPDPKWLRRHCSCDEKLYNCVTKDLNPTQLAWAKEWGFYYETCFRETSLKINGTWHSMGNQFWGFLDTLPTLVIDDIELGPLLKK